jgi:hypothetical protein
VSELWASADHQRTFNDDVLLPVLNKVGIQMSGPAEIIPVHELFQF